MTNLYAQYRAKLRALVTSAMPEDAFESAILQLARDLRDDLARLNPAKREVLCDDLGVQLESELYRATDSRQRRVLIRLLKVLDHT